MKKENRKSLEAVIHNTFKERIKGKRGITLVALVITIIILIILATVAINFAFGSNGLIRRAEDARDYYANDTAYTDESMANVESYLDELISGAGGGDTVLPADGSFSEEKGVNTPKLGANMDLVVFAEDRNEWRVDSTNSGYSYKEQTGTTENGGTSEWANAKVTTQVGDQTIESYFVWIPRYAYKIDSTNQTIDIKFIKGTGKETVDGTPCKYVSENPTADDYIVHPAFTDEEENGGWDSQIAGIWVGKYETARSDTEGSTQGTATTLKVQPNVTSYRNETIANMYTYSKAYAPNLESHMLKNSEWGAVAYLTESKYGRNGTEVTINNNGGTFFTGGGDNNAYVTNTNQSSTGNVYGIYDLSGNAYEYVAAGYSNRSEIETTNGSTKFATVYESTGSTSTNQYYKYGDATHETSGWHSDGARFVSSYYPFFLRGGNWSDGDGAGVFCFYSLSGSGSFSFRLALVV